LLRGAAEGDGANPDVAVEALEVPGVETCEGALTCSSARLWSEVMDAATNTAAAPTTAAM
jgi:hypothetical protein